MASFPDNAAEVVRFPLSKRLFDLGFILVTAPLTVPLALVLAVLLRVVDGGPVLYRSQRAGTGGVPFWALKFRTMREVQGGVDAGVSGGNKAFRISRFSAVLRRTRLDEMPQLINVLRGQMSLVGPRPPDLEYAARFPEIYDRVLQSRPGLTGLATLHMHRFEDRVLKACRTAEETDEVYCRRCIPRKARLDLMYQRRTAEPGVVCMDVLIILLSIRSVLR